MTYYGINYGSSIQHHGIKGMKWGVRRTPEQLGHKVNRLAMRRYDIGAKEKSIAEKRMAIARKVAKIKTEKRGALTSSDRKKVNALLGKSSSLQRKTEKLQIRDSKTAEKLEKYEKKKAKAEERAEAQKRIISGPKKPISEVIKSGNANEILSRKNEMTETEFSEAYRRLNTERQIKDLQDREKTRGEQFINQVTKTAGTVSSLYESYQKIAKVTDALGLTDNLSKAKLGPYDGKSEKQKLVDRIISQASASEVYENRKKLTAEQLEKANKRLAVEESLKKKMAEELKSK